MNRSTLWIGMLAPALLGAAGFGAIAWLVEDRKIAAFDRMIIRLVQGWESAPLTVVMHFFSAIGTGIPLLVIMLAMMAVLYWGVGHRQELLFFIGVAAGSALLNLLLKQLFQRARPTLHRIAEASGYSFPSGHSMTAFSLYGVLAFLLWKHIPRRVWRVSLLVASAAFILAIGISRIYLGVHYPSDVAAGYLASGCWLATCIWLYQFYRERQWARSQRKVMGGR